MSALTDHIKNNIDIVTVASRYMKLKRSGVNYVSLSPFKKERTPSFVVSPQKQIFKCFSTGIGGNVITLIMELEKIDFMDAIKTLASIGGLDITPYLKDTQYSKEYGAKKQAIKRMNSLVHSFSQEHFSGSLAQSYLKEVRNIEDALVARFGLGYVPDSYDALTKFLQNQGFDHEQQIQAGLLKQSDKGPYAFFRHRLLFPIWDHMDNIVGFGARALEKDQQPKYLNTSDTALYDKSKILYGINFVKKHSRDTGSIIVVEGYMDVIALHQAGYYTAVATCGTSLTKSHVMMMQRYTSDIYFLFDNDEAGVQATLRGLKLAYERNVFPRMLSLPSDYKDIDDMVREKKQESEAFLHSMIEQAEDGFVWVFSYMRSALSSSPVDQQKLLRMMFDLIHAMDSLTTQMYYLQYLAEQLGTNSAYIQAEYKQYIKSGKKRGIVKSVKEEVTPGYRPKKEILLASLLTNDFFSSLVDDLSYWQKIHDFLKELSGYHAKELFAQVLLQQEIQEKDVALLEQEQLWWENELGGVQGDSAKYQLVRGIVLDEINRLVKHTLKHSSLPLEQKQKLLFGMRDLMKKS